jgi:hypothetical protein
VLLSDHRALHQTNVARRLGSEAEPPSKQPSVRSDFPTLCRYACQRRAAHALVLTISCRAASERNGQVELLFMRAPRLKPAGLGWQRIYASFWRPFTAHMGSYEPVAQG